MKKKQLTTLSGIILITLASYFSVGCSKKSVDFMKHMNSFFTSTRSEIRNTEKNNGLTYSEEGNGHWDVYYTDNGETILAFGNKWELMDHCFVDNKFYGAIFESTGAYSSLYQQYTDTEEKLNEQYGSANYSLETGTAFSLKNQYDNDKYYSLARECIEGSRYDYYHPEDYSERIIEEDGYSLLISNNFLKSDVGDYVHKLECWYIGESTIETEQELGQHLKGAYDDYIKLTSSIMADLTSQAEEGSGVLISALNKTLLARFAGMTVMNNGDYGKDYEYEITTVKQIDDYYFDVYLNYYLIDNYNKKTKEELTFTYHLEFSGVKTPPFRRSGNRESGRWKL